MGRIILYFWCFRTSHIQNGLSWLTRKWCYVSILCISRTYDSNIWHSLFSFSDFCFLWCPLFALFFLLLNYFSTPKSTRYIYSSELHREVAGYSQFEKSTQSIQTSFWTDISCSSQIFDWVLKNGGPRGHFMGNATKKDSYAWWFVHPWNATLIFCLLAAANWIYEMCFAFVSMWKCCTHIAI